MKDLTKIALSVILLLGIGGGCADKKSEVYLMGNLVHPKASSAEREQKESRQIYDNFSNLAEQARRSPNADRPYETRGNRDTGINFLKVTF